MSDQMKEALLATFVEFPEFEFILKMDPNREDKKLFESAKNVHIFEWVQQPTILGKTSQFFIFYLKIKKIKS